MINAASEGSSSEPREGEDGVWVIDSASQSISDLLNAAETSEQLIRVGSKIFRISLLKSDARPSARDLLSKGGPVD